MALVASTMVMVAVWPLTTALPAVAVPEIVTPAAASALLMMLLPSIGVIAMVGAVVARVKVTGALTPVLPAASVSWATMLLLPFPTVTMAVHAPLALTVAVPIGVVPPFSVSSSVTVDPMAASPAAAVTVPEIVCVAWLTTPPFVLIATLGATVSRVNTTGTLAPVLPAASVSLATMLWLPSPESVMEVLQAPPVPTVAVPIAVPLSYSVTVVPGAASVALTVPEIVCVAWFVVPPAVLIATVGATVSRVNNTGALAPVLPAASVSLATMLWLPSPESVMEVLQIPSVPTVAVPIAVPLSYRVTVVPGAASVALTVPEIVCVA